MKDVNWKLVSQTTISDFFLSQGYYFQVPVIIKMAV